MVYRESAADDLGSRDKKNEENYEVAEYIQLKGTICRNLALPAFPRQLQTQAISSDGGTVADLRCNLIPSRHFGHSKTSW